MDKEQLIKKAWEESKIEASYNEDGWARFHKHVPVLWFMDEEKWFSDYFYRPKCLQGIENNNGWILIKTESELPNDSELNFDNQPRYRAGKFSNDGIFYIHLKDTNWFQMRKAYMSELVTHYQLIEKIIYPHY
jgi:hypothetical protein